MKNAFGSTRAVYMLARKGAQFVARARGAEVRDLDWRPDKLDRELLFIRHTLAINDFRIMLTLAANAKNTTMEWTDERTLRRRDAKDYVDDPKNNGQRLAVVPDGYFLLKIDGHDNAFALELDRGTVEEKPFKAKIRALGQWKFTGAYERRYGRKTLRVLFVVSDLTRDVNRLDRMKRWTEAEGGRSLFWFARLDALAPESLLSGQVWMKAGSGERHSLI